MRASCASHSLWWTPVTRRKVSRAPRSSTANKSVKFAQLFQGRPANDLSAIINAFCYGIRAAQCTEVCYLVRRGPQHSMGHSHLAQIGEAHDQPLAIYGLRTAGYAAQIAKI